MNYETEIARLKAEQNAILLAHYYQDDDIQDIADFVGDSLELARKAAGTSADVIVFSGVRFMAEGAKILNPTKTVLIPDMNAGCSLEDSCPPKEFAAFCKAHPDHMVVTYINCSAEVKVKELGSNLILGGHREVEAFEVKNSRLVVGLKCRDRTGSRLISCTFTVLSD